ncbi:STAS-like domain-containing protein [Robiginitalea sp. M366]|uniref:STAS-like domain-containing protein n=1 Tax=Robiginitalea aestuariiviva TaxID=3036903 RepID=UPI00240E16A5|nr:STAS-like domain-containing protein [Robiginitalea aestuariiviva]MDG1573310.1 STAS-like domain-containing protein [Robiginitalea aestuariiviva]
MKTEDTIIIAKEFAEDPGAREIADGDNSAEKFYNTLLLPKFKRAIAEDYSILIDLDGVFGYPSSFVSGSFGKLSLEYGSDKVLSHLKFKSDRRPIRIDKIVFEIKNPASQKFQ